MHEHPQGRAPDYTMPALVMAAINLFWMLGVIWAVFGLPVVLALAWALKTLIDAIGARRGGS
ncbi:hypothetical protein FIU97_07410 [Roseivivax sp. THAF40]|uniref:hypothetical protein n=1 Tax=unclassified Roseivivax TaxID=2639302 RepID=UPI001267F8B2|nr:MULTISPECIES: hypothetical protein [unclassified Roseivivax]QFS82630.1 hypothetical protein FIV09_07305 [Roseivivax sp. THAF197b]QFT46399.1 hypothetical protein FIU97_07410 [Roseivivax sp. THAF40]